jgi:hypothetical protein
MPNYATHPIPPEELKKDYPAGVFPPPEYRPPEYLAYLERAAAAIKTVRLIVYAGMLGFLLVSSYGFFLIYELTVDAHEMVGHAMRMSEQMQSMTRIIGNMRESLADMRADMRGLRVDIGKMDHSLTTMTADVSHMANTVALIQHSARNLDANLAPAGNMMNTFMPWSRTRYGSPPFAPPAP